MLESVYTAAAGVVRNQSANMNAHGEKKDLLTKIETNIYLMNYGTYEEQEQKVEETYRNGKYVVTVDDGVPTSQTGVEYDAVEDYCLQIMTGQMGDPVYWQDVTLEDLGSVYLMEFTYNSDFGDTMQNLICSEFWDDPGFLNNLATAYVNNETTGYIGIDKYTGLPTSAGYYYEGTHTIDGDDYTLSLQADQSIEAPAKGAYKEITEELPEEEEPENKATPLFYHVTGAEGQEMWLLGTIHVGDERTGFLPQEIYDAFNASDALALECNTEAFDEQLENDDALSEQVSNLYFFSNGTTIENLIPEFMEKYAIEEEESEATEETEETGETEETEATDDAEEEEDAYAQAVNLMKATGNYNMNMPYAKPYVWSSSIEDFYLRQGYQLHRDQGVEERLMDWAEELEKEILEVESNMFQIKMLTGFSNDLQMLMLDDAMSADGREYWESTMDLYEKWCAGDEAALREELSDEVDMTDWTEEEIAQYEKIKHLLDEYNKAMSYDRNDGMLDVAIDYLESGKVVFYAVGLAHLLNDVNGLVDTLREAGYTVELVQYAE